MHAEYRYTLYDEQGKFIDHVFGPSVDVVKTYLKRRGWSGVNAGGVKNWYKGELRKGQRVGRVYGRVVNKKTKEATYKHVTYLRELWSNDMEFSHLRRPDFVWP